MNSIVLFVLAAIASINALTVPAGFREFDGSNGNIGGDMLAGAVDTDLLRLGAMLGNVTNFPNVLGSFYTDGISMARDEMNTFPVALIVPESANQPFPSARLVSNVVASLGGGLQVNTRALSDWLTFWGQFMDHDLGLTEGISIDIVAGVNQSFNIIVPPNDPNPEFLAAGELPFDRAIFNPLTGIAPGNPRQQINEITSYLDASNVYGETNAKAQALRGANGMLQTSGPNGLLLPTVGQIGPIVGQANPSQAVVDAELFSAGDVRANENIALASLHTLFMREHNRLAAGMTGDSDTIFFESRRVGYALQQQVLFQEYSPLLLGDFDVPAYGGAPVMGVDAGTFNEFSNAVFRYGHTELNTNILRFDPQTGVQRGNIDLAAAFFNPNIDGVRVTEDDIDSIYLGLTMQQQRNVDPFVVDDIRETLFANGGMMGMDLIALNIQRGRDCGLPTFQDLRRILREMLPANHPDPSLFNDYTSFDDMRARNPAHLDAINLLEMAYGPQNGSIELVDIWVGVLSEDHVFNSQFGPTIHETIRRQYQSFRDGDAFFWDQPLPRGNSQDMRDSIRATLLSDIILRNSNVQQIPCNVMVFNDGVMCFANSASTVVASFAAIIAAFALLM